MIDVNTETMSAAERHERKAVTPAEIIRNFVARPRTAAEILQDEINRHNAAVEEKKAEKRYRKAVAKKLGKGGRAAP